MPPAADPVDPDTRSPADLADGAMLSDVAKALRDVLSQAKAGRTDEAETGCKAIVARDPEQVEALHLLGMLQYSRGAYREAAETLDRVCLLQPDFGQAKLSQIVALAKSGAIDEAAQKAADLKKTAADAPELMYVLGLASEKDGKLPEARARFEAAAALAPNFVDAFVSLGALLLRVGEPHGAGQVLDQVSELLTSQDSAADLPIRAVCRDPVSSARDIIDAHFAWGVRHGMPAPADLPEPVLTVEADRPLRLGILASGDLFAPFAGAARALAEGLSGTDITPVLYGTHALEAPNGVEYVNIDGLSDLEFVRRVCDDRIDVLIDCIAHDAGGRQAALGYSPAPVQLAWGLPVGGRDFAFLLTDRTLVPESMADGLPQRPWHIDGSVIQVPAFGTIPEVKPKPSRERNPEPILACFCDGSRVTSGAIDHWIECMRRLPGSRFALTNAELADGLIRQAVETAFQERGIDPRRLAMAQLLSPERFLDVMADIDVMIDPIPLSDPATAARALVMGVPVVAIENDNPWSRSTASLLRALDLDELIGEDQDDVTAIVAGLASDTRQLNEYRNTLRDRVEGFRAEQTTRLSQAVATAVRSIWRDWCASMQD